MVNNHGDIISILSKKELAPLAHPVLAFASEVGFALPAAVLYAGHTSQERKVYWDVFRNLGYE